MKIIDKYIFREFITPFCYCFFAFIILFMIGDLFENLDDFLKQKVSWQLVVRYYVLLIPTIFVWTTPLIVLLSLLYQLGYMGRYSELIALKAGGISLWRIAVPFIIIGTFLGCSVFAVNEQIIPGANRIIGNIKETHITKKSQKKTYDKLTYFSNAHNMSIYIKELSLVKNIAKEISIREFYRNGTIKREWYGERGIWVDDEWWIFNGYIRHVDMDGNIVGKILFFKKHQMPINIPPQDLMYNQDIIEKLGDHMSYKQLKDYMERNYLPGMSPQELKVDLYRKLSTPISILIVSLLGIAFGFRISKGGAMASVGASIGFYLVYYGINSMFLALGKLGRIMPIIAVWAPHILFGIMGGVILKKVR